MFTLKLHKASPSRGNRQARLALWITLCLQTLCLAPGLQAATQGELGASSQGSINISLTVKPMVRVSKLQDIVLSTVQGNVAAGSSPLCVFTNGAAEYGVQAIGSGPAEAFLLTSDAGQVSYQVELIENAQRTRLHANTASDSHRAGLDPSCSGNNAQIAITISDTEVAPATYTGTLTLLVTPS